MSKCTHRWMARANQAGQTAAHLEETPAYLNRPRPLEQAPPLILSLDPTLLRSAFSLLYLSAHVLPGPPLPSGNILTPPRSSSQAHLFGKTSGTFCPPPALSPHRPRTWWVRCSPHKGCPPGACGCIYQPRNPKNGQQPPEAGGGAWGRLSLNSLGRHQPCQPLDFGFPVSRPWENKSLLFVVFCYGHPRTLIQALAHLPDGDTEAQLVGGDGWEWAGLGSPLGAA